MPEIRLAFQNTSNFSSSEWTTDDIYVSDANFITFLCKSSVSSIMYLIWKIDESTTSISETKTVIANENTSMYSPVKARFVRFKVDSFSSLPCVLQTQAFFY